MGESQTKEGRTDKNNKLHIVKTELMHSGRFRNIPVFRF